MKALGLSSMYFDPLREQVAVNRLHHHLPSSPWTQSGLEYGQAWIAADHRAMGVVCVLQQ